MALYQYKGIDSSGREKKGQLAADNVVQAKQKVKTLGIMLTSIKEQKSAGPTNNKSGLSLGGGVSVEVLALMTRQLATLLKAKIQIVEAFNALIDQTENDTLKVVLSEIRQKVNEGSSLAKAMGDYPKIFDNVYVNMVEAGEQSGTLDIVLLRLADFTEAQVKLKNKIKGSMTYPVVMIVFGSIMMGIIFVFVIPKITKIFVSMKKELPLQTEICIWISDFLKGYWWAVIFGVILTWIMFNRYISTKSGEKKWHALLLKMPIVGKLTTMINVSRFCSTLETLLSSGVPIITAMKIVMNLVSNVHIRSTIALAKDSVQEGGTIAKPLKESGLFPSMVTHMIALGERSGEIEPMLKIVAENYEDQVNSKLNGLTSTLEPIMMVAMGGAVAFIVFSVVVPMMELSSMK